MRVLATGACTVGIVVALWFALQAAGDLALTGFPDSHFTDYDKAVEVPKRILMWTEFGLVPLFVLFALPRIRERARAVGPVVALIVLGLVVLAQLIGVPWYFGSHLGLDNGIGG
jgi:hypothetical protein